MLVSQFGIVATGQTLSSQAGATILEDGDGNAIDAAITANAILGVVQPGGNGTGRDLSLSFTELPLADSMGAITL